MSPVIMRDSNSHQLLSRLTDNIWSAVTLSIFKTKHFKTAFITKHALNYLTQPCFSFNERKWIPVSFTFLECEEQAVFRKQTRETEGMNSVKQRIFMA